MSNRKLIVLFVIASLMVVWAVFQSNISDKPKAQPGSPVYLIQGLDPADIGSIVLGTGEKAITLELNGGRFVVANKDNYPSVTSRVNELITKCLDIKTTELYTDDKANHRDLGVTEENAETIVKFFRPDSSLLTGVIVGKTREQDQGSYVRLASSEKVYVTLQSPWIGSEAMNYIDQQLVSINRDDIESVTVSGADGYTLKAKEPSGDVVLQNLPAGKKLKDSVAKNVFLALANLRFDDVKKQSSVKETLNFDRQFICKLKDSTVYTIKIAKKDGKTYVTCDAEFTDKTLVTKQEVQDANDAELKQKEAKLLAYDKANEFSAKHRGWIYEIPDYKADNMTKVLSELVEDEQKPQESTETAEPNTIGSEQ